MRALVNIIYDPFATKPCHTEWVDEGLTIRDVAIDLVKTDLPFICLYNGKALMRDSWGRKTKPGDSIVFVVVLGTFIPTWVWWAIAIASAVYVYLSLPEFPLQDTSDSESVNNIQGQRNQNKLGKPIECGYGSVRMYPSLAARSYNKYINNDQYVYTLFSMGHGDWEINEDEIYLEDTPLFRYEDLEVEIYKQGENPNLFPNNVDTSASVNNIEITYYLNEDASLRIFGPYITTEPLSKTKVIEMDFVFPRGLYKAAGAGEAEDHTVEIEALIAPIDDFGIETDVPIAKKYTFTGSTTTPLRFTKTEEVPEARYMVSVFRKTAYSEGTYGEEVRWGALRAYLPSTTSFPVITIAFKGRASNNFNDGSANRFNLWATRKLPVWDGSSWSEPVPTRSKVWAAVDALKASYGANLGDGFIDLDTMLSLDRLYESRKEYFDWVFDQRTGVWDTLKTIFGSGRAVPTIIGSKVSAIRDTPSTVPIALFNKSNIVEGTFQMDVVIDKLNEEDGLEVEFTDPTIGQPNTVLCLVGDDEGESPKIERIAGIADRTHAWREGMYRRARNIYSRISISFETGRQGFLLQINDKIAVVMDYPTWGIGGTVLAISGGGEDGPYVLTLSEPVEIDTESRIAISLSDGTMTSPLLCEQGSSPKKVVILDEVDASKILTSTDYKQSGFAIGKTNEVYKLCEVAKVIPKSIDTVVVEAMVYTEEHYAYDSQEPEEETLIDDSGVKWSREAPSPIRYVNFITSIIDWNYGSYTSEAYKIFFTPELVDNATRYVFKLKTWTPDWGPNEPESDTATGVAVASGTMTPGKSYYYIFSKGGYFILRISAFNSFKGSEETTFGPYLFGDFLDSAKVVDDEGNTVQDDDGSDTIVDPERVQDNSLNERELVVIGISETRENLP
jgi:hypothetical protein